MIRRPSQKPFYDPLSDDESPVIDPGSPSQASPEPPCDKEKTPDVSPKESAAAKPKDAYAASRKQETDQKSILEQLREARVDKEKAEAEKAAVAECPHCAEAEKGRLLALAELENARKRLAREKEEFIKFAGEAIVSDILPALDNLDLALEYAPKGPECQNFVVGVDMTRKLLLDALAKHGLEQVGSLGEVFDPTKHEAVAMEPDAAYQNGEICALMNKGYRLKDRLIRPARVKVCKND